jgi:hypothetical protein
MVDISKAYFKFIVGFLKIISLYTCAFMEEMERGMVHLVL